MEWMAKELPKGRYHYCPDAGHMAMYDDQDVYFAGLTQFLRDVDAGKF
jgi:proline iminopeptidase